MADFKAWCITHSSKISLAPSSPSKRNHKKFSVLAFTFLVYLIMAGTVSPPAAAAYMFAAEVNYSSPYGYLKEIDQGAGNLTNAGPNPIGLPEWGEIMGMSASPYAGWVYGAETEEDKLWRINVVTGLGEALQDFDRVINGLAYDFINDILYGTEYENLYIVDQGTGATTLVGSFGSGITDAWALDYDTATGRIYGVNAMLTGSGQLFWADTSTGAATIIGDAGRDRITDIAFDWETGILYGIENSSDPEANNFFFKIDFNENTGTVTTTNIGTGMGTINVKGLAKPIPEPATFLLLVSGLLGLTRLIRKKSDRS